MLKQKSSSQKGGAFAPKFPGGRKSMGRGRVPSSQIMKLAGVDQDETYKKSLQAMDQLRAVKANLAQVMDSAEKASTEFPADKLHDEDHMADKERVWSILEDYEKLCTEREKVLFSLEHFFNTSKEDPSMRRRQIPIILEGTDWSSDHETDDDDTSDQDKEAKREFEKAFTVAQESAIRLKDLNAEVVHIATLINRIALGNFNWKANPFSDLKGILRQVTDSNYVAETKVLEAQSMFDQLIASVHDIARRNSQLKKAKSDQEKQLDASIARNVSLKTENESLKGAIRTPELELEKARKELDALREEVREKSDKVEECTALIEDLVDEKKTLVVEIEATSATSQEVLNEKSKLVQQKNEELKKQSLVIKRLEDESKRKADRIRELETSVAAVAAPPATADATSTFVVDGDDDDDDHMQLIAENCDLKRELTRCRHRIRYLEELVRSFLLKRQQAKSTHVLPELPLPSKILKGGQRSRMATTPTTFHSTSEASTGTHPPPPPPPPSSPPPLSLSLGSSLTRRRHTEATLISASDDDGGDIRRHPLLRVKSVSRSGADNISDFVDIGGRPAAAAAGHLTPLAITPLSSRSTSRNFSRGGLF